MFSIRDFRERFISVLTLFPLVILILGGCTKSNVFIEYHRNGGFVNLNDTLIIDKDGNVNLKRGESRFNFKLEENTLNNLKRMINDNEFSNLDKEYLPPQQGGDLIEYKITYNGRTIRMMDTVIPDSLQPIMGSLDQIIESGH